MKLLVVMKTYSRDNRDPSRERYCKAPKSEVMLRCLYSVVRSLASLQGDIKLALINNKDDTAHLDTIRAITSLMPHPTEIVFIDPPVPPVAPTANDRQTTPGAALAAFQYGLAHGEGGLVYFVDDDYLHDEGAIGKMLAAQDLFSRNLGHPACIDGFNDPFRYYEPRNIELTRVVHGPDRHWRLTYFSTATFLIPHSILKTYWYFFEALGKHPSDGKAEDDTVNHLWKEAGVPLFMPIPSVSLHLQFDTEKDPFIDWESWWKKADYRAAIQAR